MALQIREITLLKLTISIVYASHGGRNCRRSVKGRNRAATARRAGGLAISIGPADHSESFAVIFLGHPGDFRAGELEGAVTE